MVEENTSSLALSVDPEPSSLRFVLLAILFAGLFIGYSLTNLIFGISSCSLLGIFGGFLVGGVSMQLSERFLKPRWKSNRFLHLNYESIQYVQQDKSQEIIKPTEEFEVHMWAFEIKRRHRVPKGWYVVAMALEQNSVYLPVFTLISPENFETLPSAKLFTRLKGRKELESEGGNMRIAGQQKRLLRAESARTLDGMEMNNGDFARYIEWLQTNFPEWMPSA